MVGSGRKIDEGKIGREKGGFSRSCPSLPSFFSPRVSFWLAAYDLTYSPLSKRLEQANNLKAKTWGQKEQDKKQRF